MSQPTRTISVQLLIIFVLTISFAISACGASGDDSKAETEQPNASTEAESEARSAQELETNKSAITIVAMGDSLTEGLGVDPELAYPAKLQERLSADGYSVSVVNAGISGETSSGALTRVDWILNLEPDIVILTIGANDGLRGINPELTLSNIDTIVADFMANDVTVVLGGMQIVQNMGEEYVHEFREIYPEVAETRGTILIPFFLKDVAGDMSLNQPDAIHPTADGYTVVVNTIYPYVKQALAERP